MCSVQASHLNSTSSAHAAALKLPGISTVVDGACDAHAWPAPWPSYILHDNRILAPLMEVCCSMSKVRDVGAVRYVPPWFPGSSLTSVCVMYTNWLCGMPLLGHSM